MSINNNPVNESLFNNLKIFFSDLFQKDNNIPYLWNIDFVKQFPYAEEIMTDNFAIFPFCFNFNNYLPFNIHCLTDTNYCFAFDLNEFIQVAFNVNSDFNFNTFYISNQSGYIKSFQSTTEHMNAVEFFDCIINDKAKSYSIKEKKIATIKWLNNLPHLIKNTYTKNPKCFKILCDKFYINHQTVDIINEHTLELKDKFVFNFNFDDYNYELFGIQFNEKNESAILSFYDSLNINQDNYKLFVENDEQIKFLRYFDELSFNYQLRPNTLYCKALKDNLLEDNYEKTYGILLRLFYLKKDIIPFIEILNKEQKDKILEEHIKIDNLFKNNEIFSIDNFVVCNSLDYKKIDFSDYYYFSQFPKNFLYEKLNSSLVKNNNSEYKQIIKI